MKYLKTFENIDKFEEHWDDEKIEKEPRYKIPFTGDFVVCKDKKNKDIDKFLKFNIGRVVDSKADNHGRIKYAVTFKNIPRDLIKHFYSNDNGYFRWFYKSYMIKISKNLEDIYENFHEDWEEEEKETIRMSDIVNGEYLGDIEGFTLIEEVQDGFDAEKGFADLNCVIKRDKDGKFFRVEYTQFGYNGTDLSDQIAVEVEKKQKTIDYYE